MIRIERPCTGPLRLGVPREVHDLLTSDPLVEWAGDDPVIVPIGHLPWWSEAFFASNGFGELAPLSYVDWESARDLLEQGGSPLDAAARPGIWVTEVPSDRSDEVDDIIGRTVRLGGGTATRRELLADGPAVEEHYGVDLDMDASALTGAAPFNPRAAWESLVRSGTAVECALDGPSMYTPEHPVPPEQVWDLYEQTMSILSLHHPIDGVIPRPEFERLSQDEHGCLLLLCDSGKPVSLALLATRPEEFPWLDQRWVEQLRGPDCRDLLMIPGIATDLDHRGHGLIDHLLDVVVELVLAGGRKVVVSFPCNNLSRYYTPRLSQAAVDRSGSRLRGTVEMVASYEFRAWDVNR